MSDYERTKIGPPATPSANATVVLFDSTATYGKAGLSGLGICRVKLCFPGLSQASAASGLKGYVSGDKGTTWSPCTFSVTGSTTALPVQVTAQTATDFCWYDIAVSCFEDVRFELTVGATAPSAATWALVGIFLERFNVGSSL